MKRFIVCLNRNLRIFGIYHGGKECNNKLILILFIEVLGNYFQKTLNNPLESMCDLIVFSLCGFRSFSLCRLLFVSPLIKGFARPASTMLPFVHFFVNYFPAAHLLRPYRCIYWHQFQIILCNNYVTIMLVKFNFGAVTIELGWQNMRR